MAPMTTAAQQNTFLPDLEPAELLAWCNETDWLANHGKPVRSFISEDTHKELRPIFAILKDERSDRVSGEELLRMFTV